MTETLSSAGEGAPEAAELTTLQLLGSTFRIQSTVAAFTDAVRSAWRTSAVPPARRAASRAPEVVDYHVSAAAGTVTVATDAGPTGATVELPATRPSWGEALGVLAVDLNWRALMSYDGFAVHAGVVAGGDGAICFPADSGDGKTTLVAACVRAGLGYVSDEALSVRYDGTLEAYTKPLTMSPWTVAVTGVDQAAICVGDEWLVAPEALGAVCAAAPSLRHVIEPRRSAAGAPQLTALHRSEGVQLLLRNSFNHYRRPQETLALVGRLARHVDVWRLDYSDPAAAAELLRDRLGGTYDGRLHR